MSIDKHFEKRGVELSDDNSLPPGQRSQRNVKRVIAAVRAAEAEFNDELRDANERCRTAQQQVIELQDHVRTLESELKRYKVSERLQTIDTLTTADKTKLLDVAS